MRSGKLTEKAGCLALPERCGRPTTLRNAECNRPYKVNVIDGSISSSTTRRINIHHPARTPAMCAPPNLGRSVSPQRACQALRRLSPLPPRPLSAFSLLLALVIVATDRTVAPALAGRRACLRRPAHAARAVARAEGDRSLTVSPAHIRVGSSSSSYQYTHTPPPPLQSGTPPGHRPSPVVFAGAAGHRRRPLGHHHCYVCGGACHHRATHPACSRLFAACLILLPRAPPRHQESPCCSVCLLLPKAGIKQCLLLQPPMFLHRHS